MAIDVAVLGSCVSRDLFNSKFNPDYKKFYECVLTQNQTSIISLMSEPTPYTPNPEDKLSAYQEWNVRSDFSKEILEQLKETQPSYVILDFFADIHFGCIELGPNQFITDNRWMLHKTSFYKSIMKQQNPLDEETEAATQSEETDTAPPAAQLEEAAQTKRTLESQGSVQTEEMAQAEGLVQGERFVETEGVDPVEGSAHPEGLLAEGTPNDSDAVQNTDFSQNDESLSPARRLTLDENEAEYLELWKCSVDKLFAFLAAEVPNCQVILHQARNVEGFVDKEGNYILFAGSGKALPIDTKIFNERWSTLDNYVLENYSVHSIDVFHEGLQSYEGHPWGPFYVHYTMDYYHDCMNQLHRIILDDRLSTDEDQLYLTIVSDLEKSDKEKTKVIAEKEQTIGEYQDLIINMEKEKEAENAQPVPEPSISRRVKHLFWHKLLKPIRKVYNRLD